MEARRREQQHYRNHWTFVFHTFISSSSSCSSIVCLSESPLLFRNSANYIERNSKGCHVYQGKPAKLSLKQEHHWNVFWKDGWIKWDFSDVLTKHLDLPFLACLWLLLPMLSSPPAHQPTLFGAYHWQKPTFGPVSLARSFQALSQYAKPETSVSIVKQQEMHISAQFIN